MGNNTKVVKLIATWMVLVSYPWIDYFYSQRGFIPQSFLEGLALLGIVWILFCALGLMFLKEMARLWSVWIFSAYFFWSFYLVCFNIAPSFSATVDWLSGSYHLPINVVQGVMMTFLITHMMWPFVVVMYLTNPSVKMLFNPDFEPEYTV